MEGGRLAATEVDGLMLGDQWGLTTTSIQTTLISQKCYPRLNHAQIFRQQYHFLVLSTIGAVADEDQRQYQLK